MGRWVTAWSRATQSSGRHVPSLRGRGDEHHARRRTHAPHVLVDAANAVRAVGVLVAVGLVAVGLDDLHARHLRAEFIRDQDRQRTADPLPHLRAVAHDGDDAVRADMDEDVGVQPGAAPSMACEPVTGLGAGGLPGSFVGRCAATGK